MNLKTLGYVAGIVAGLAVVGYTGYWAWRLKRLLAGTDQAFVDACRDDADGLLLAALQQGLADTAGLPALHARLETLIAQYHAHRAAAAA